MEENGEDSHAMPPAEQPQEQTNVEQTEEPRDETEPKPSQTEGQEEEHEEEHGENHDEDHEEEEEPFTAESSGKETEEKQVNSKQENKESESDAPEEVQAPESKTPAKSSQKSNNKEPVTPASADRPARERKSIDRFINSVEKEKVREFKIEKGSGTCLKDIPNIAFKFSKRKGTEEPVQLLHKLMYARKVKTLHVKANILQFSGYVWGANQEKERAKVREKLEKCVKESLLQISDMLDLNIPKTAKKEDLVAKILEFLEAPYPTSDMLLEEIEHKSKKRKKTPTITKGKRSTAVKKNKQDSKSPRKQYDDEDEEEDDEEIEEDAEEEEPVKKRPSAKGRQSNFESKSPATKKHSQKLSKQQVEEVEEEEEEEDEDGLDEPPEDDDDDEEEEEEEPEEKSAKKRSRGNKYDHDTKPRSPKKIILKYSRKTSVYDPKGEGLDDETEVKTKPLNKVSKKQAGRTAVASPTKEEKRVDTPSRKKKKREEPDVKDNKPKKGRGSNQVAPAEETKTAPCPSDNELRAAICDFLRDADFSTVTFTDVVRQLGTIFNIDLSQHKAHVKILIQEEISKIVDEDEADGEDEPPVQEDTGKKALSAEM